MLIVLGTLILLSLIFGPQLWTQHILKRYKVQIDEIPGTGGELARHLLDKLNMEEIQVVLTVEVNDHYEPL